MHYKTLHHENYKSTSQPTHKSASSMLHTRALSHYRKGPIHSYIKLCTSNTIVNQPVKTQNCLHLTYRMLESIVKVKVLALVSIIPGMLVGYLTGGER